MTTHSSATGLDHQLERVSCTGILDPGRASPRDWLADVRGPQVCTPGPAERQIVRDATATTAR